MATFIRFVVGGDDEDHRVLSGLISEARLLRDQGYLSKQEDEFLEDVYVWFNSNLPCPPFSSAGWSRDAVTWFKDSANDSIRKIRELAVLLERHGKFVRTLQSKNPGKILYEDDQQVVVEE
jgi:hypothetical protein